MQGENKIVIITNYFEGWQNLIIIKQKFKELLIFNTFSYNLLYFTVKMTSAYRYPEKLSNSLFVQSVSSY